MSEGAGHPKGGLEPGADRPSDEALVSAIRSSASAESVREAWRELLVRHLPMVRVLCRQMLGRGPGAEDACQESVVRVMRGISGFDERSRVSTWMYRVALNTCLSRIRDEGRRGARSLQAPPQNGQDEGFGGAARGVGEIVAQSREPIPGVGVEQGDDRALVGEALLRLDPDLRSVLLLRDAQGLDYAQIAELLEVRVGTVKSRLFRARLALRQAFEGIRAERLGPRRARDGTE